MQTQMPKQRKGVQAAGLFSIHEKRQEIKREGHHLMTAGGAEYVVYFEKGKPVEVFDIVRS
ncbi:MAG: hypothetical protein NT157_02760, partial [Candidatus Micrarchaeota archaeon]|nr:hypothetical protein [Candidatus Micrarchaeota archaeon]